MEGHHYPREGLHSKRRLIADYMNRYRKLREQGRVEDAAVQLRLAAQVADESMEETILVARRLLLRIEHLCRQERSRGGIEGS